MWWLLIGSPAAAPPGSFQVYRQHANSHHEEAYYYRSLFCAYHQQPFASSDRAVVRRKIEFGSARVRAGGVTITY